MQKTGITWDSVPVQGVMVKDLRNDNFDIFREQAVLSKRMDHKDVEATNEQLLDSLNLLENGQLKRGAILLFIIIRKSGYQESMLRLDILNRILNCGIRMKFRAR